MSVERIYYEKIKKLESQNLQMAELLDKMMKFADYFKKESEQDKAIIKEIKEWYNSQIIPTTERIHELLGEEREYE